MMRANMPKQLMPGKNTKAPKPKNTKGMSLPAAIGKPKTDHGKMNFKKGGYVKGC